MKPTTTAKILENEETELFRELAYTKLDALWQELEVTGRSIKLKPEDREQKLMWWLVSFTAEKAVEYGMEKDELVQTASEAFDNVEVEDEDGEEEEGEDAVTTPIILPPIAVTMTPEAGEAQGHFKRATELLVGGSRNDVAKDDGPIVPGSEGDE